MPDLIYGRNPILEALRAGQTIHEILVAAGSSPSRGALSELLVLARRSHVPVRFVPREALDRAVAAAGEGAGAGAEGGPGLGVRAGPATHQGVLAYVTEFAYTDLASILAIAIRRGEAPFLLVLDAVQDVHNLGSLIRTAEAAGVHGVLLPDRRAAGVTAAVRKASAGAIEHVAVARVALVEALDGLRLRGVRVVGLAMDGAEDYAGADLTGPLALVVGGEARGLEAAVLRRCDVCVRLPMRGQVASLNAAVAGSIVLYEALRQRDVPGGT